MLNFAQTGWLALALTWALLMPAAAQPDADNSGASVDLVQPSDLNRSHRFSPPGWHVDLKLPQTGTLHMRGDHDWSSDKLDFLWEDHDVAAGSGSIYRIEGEYYPLEFDPESVKYQHQDQLFDYCWSWLSDSLHSKIVSSRRGLEINRRRWSEFRVEEPVKPHIEGRSVKTGTPPMKYYLYATPISHGMLVLRFFYDDPPLPDLPHEIALMLHYS